MTEPSFVDSNIWVYARDPRQGRKHAVAAELIKRHWHDRTGRISAQVLNEYYTTVTRKLKLLAADSAWDDVLALMAWNPYPIDHSLLIAAREIERRYSVSWWDALIVSAAQAQHCKILISEDFQDGMVFEQLIVRNPFTDGVQEPAVSYAVIAPPQPRHRQRGRPRRPLTPLSCLTTPRAPRP